MIDQSLINHIEAVIEDSQGSAVDISTGKLTELLSSYKSLIEQNAELHKENEKNKSDANKLYDLCASSGVCSEFLRVNFAN